MLPLARRHQLVLHALAGRADQAQHERRVLIVEVVRLGAGRVQRRGGAVERERPARIVGFRLPMVQVQEIQEVASAQVVPAGQLRKVRRHRVSALVAVNRVPAVTVSDGAEAGVEHRVPCVPLIPDALIVSPGNLQDVEAEVAGVEVRPEHLLLLA